MAAREKDGGMISRLELLTFLNNAPTFGTWLDRVDRFADLLGDGSIVTTSDDDVITTVAIGDNVAAPLTLPPGAA
jgi:hypothetical protein